MRSLYIHVPFCQSKCSYCGFYSFVPNNGIKWVKLWLRALELEIQRRELQLPMASLFIGGGTPTMLAPEDLAALFALLERSFIWQPAHRETEVEKTIEANPGTLDEVKIQTLRDGGINRISLGVQSFDDNLLARLGRCHVCADTYRSVEQLRRAGYKNINFDLMFGLPGQTLAIWQDTLRRAVDLGPTHLSLYALSLEPGTPLAKGMAERQISAFEPQTSELPDQVFDLDDDQQADMYAWAVDYLKQQGYGRYEISNFCREGYRCRHNWATWQGENYWGLGPGAVSTIDGVRTQNAELPLYNYRLKHGQSPYLEKEILSWRQCVSEYVFLHLRTEEGIDRRDFGQRFGVALEDIFGPIITKYIEKNVLRDNGDRLALEPAFFFTANTVLSDFM